MFDISPLRLYGSSSIGVFMAANNLLTFLPNDVPEKVEDVVRNTLKTTIVRFSIAKSPLLGIFLVVNDNGVLLPSLALEEEIKIIKAMGLNVEVLNTKYTAISNLILASNRVALVSPS